VRDPRGFTLVELLLVLAIIGILATISIANYRHARLRGTETAAIGALSAINRAQFAYMQTCGRQKFAPHLTSLGKLNPGSTVPYLSPDLTAADEVEKSGYRIQMSGTEVLEPIQTCTGDTPVESYQVTADPIAEETTGKRYFGTNVTLVIYESAESFSGKMPETGAPPLGQEIRGAPR
jgi:prepilin-type N-terminal cleavage/methylation domain-containing protein